VEGPRYSKDEIAAINEGGIKGFEASDWYIGFINLSVYKQILFYPEIFGIFYFAVSFLMIFPYLCGPK